MEIARSDPAALDGFLRNLLARTARTLEAASASFWTVAAGGGTVTCELLFRAADGSFHARTESSPAHSRCPAWLERMAAREPGTEPEEGARLGPYVEVDGLTSRLDAPIWRDGKVLGVLCIEGDEARRRWSEHEQSFVTVVSALLCGALEGEARHRAERRYALIGQATKDVIYDYAPETGHIEWGYAPGALGYSEGQLSPRFEAWTEQIHPDDRDRVVDEMRRHLEPGQPGIRIEYRFRRGDGGWALVVDRGFVEHGPRGRTARLIGVMTDMTEQRQLQEQLALSERLASLGTLAAGVAHEINNPLAYVHVNLEFALGAIGEPGPLREALLEAAEGVNRVRRIVRDLKAFSRPEREVPQPVNLVPMLETAINMAAGELRHRAQVRRDFGTVPVVWGSEARVGQVLLNLLVNAAHAIPEGRAGEHSVLVRTGTTSDGKAFIEVVDSGRGIPPELLKRVFDPFFTTKPVGVGTGLGLSISHAIVSAMGGTLTLQNNPGRGCTARVVLPVGSRDEKSAGPAAQLPTAMRKDPGGGRARILVLDDEVQLAAAIRRMLSRRHEVVVHNRASDALEAIRGGGQFHAVRCDLMMPDISGAEFVRALGELSPSLARRVVLMTGGAFTPQAREFLATSGLRVLEKPFDTDELLSMVDAILQTPE